MEQQFNNNQEFMVTPINNDTMVINTNTNVNSSNHRVYNPNKKIISDPKGEIPTGIYGVIKWERVRIVFGFIVSSLVVISASVLITLMSAVWHLGWFAYLPAVSFGLYGVYKLFLSWVDYNGLTKSIGNYRDNLRLVGNDTKTVPTFIPNLYLSLHKKQVRHIWFTVFSLFYGGLFTMIIYFLKDVSFWFFHFDVWMKDWLGNPMLVVYLMATALSVVVLTHIYFMIARTNIWSRYSKTKIRMK